MKWLVGIVLIVAVALAGWWFAYGQHAQQAEAPLDEAAMVDSNDEIEEPEASFPIDAVETTAQVNESDEELPPVPESDPTLAAWLNTNFGQEVWTQLLRNEDLVRRAVATVENLDADKLPERANVFESPGTSLVTEELSEEELTQTEEGDGSTASEDGDEAADEMAEEPAEESADAESSESGQDELQPVKLTEDNADRYQPWVEAVRQIDDEQAIQAYVRYYPLFQKAYDDLGNDGAYFNDRLVAVIDHLLETPEVAFPIRLEPAENNRFVFADEELESLTVGQKALVRMGPENAGVFKNRLRRLRDRLAGSGGAPAAAPESSQNLTPAEDIGAIEVDLSEPMEKMSMEEVEERFNLDEGDTGGDGDGPSEEEGEPDSSGDQAEDAEPGS